MAENKWIIDGHHYTCPDCKKTIAIVVNESDEDFEFCPFCGKRMSGQMAENKMAEVAKLFGKNLGEEFILIDENREKYKAVINKNGLRVHGMYKGFWEHTLFKLIVGTAVIVDD